MASFLSTMTSIGAETVIRFLASGQELLLSRAAAGDGIAGGDQNKITELVNPIAVEVNLGEKSFVESNPSYMLIPVHVSNKGLREKQYIREIIIYGLDEKGREFPFAYSWLEGADTDNVIPESKRENYDSDTVHIHDVVVIASDQINAAVRIEVSEGSAFVTKQELMSSLANRRKIYVQEAIPSDEDPWLLLKTKNLRQVVGGDEPEEPSDAVVFITTDDETDAAVDIDKNTHYVENITTDPTKVQDGTFFVSIID